MGVYRLEPTGNPLSGLEACDSVAESSFTTEDKTELISYLHYDEDKGVSSGVWVCAPSYEKIDSYPVDELMTVVAGSVTVTDDKGVVNTFTAGDTFYIAKGAKCIWEITETLHKYFMITE